MRRGDKLLLEVYCSDPWLGQFYSYLGHPEQFGGMEKREAFLKRLSALGLYPYPWPEGKRWLLGRRLLQDLPEAEFQEFLSALEAVLE
ncbi:MAG: hypothetical protein ACK4K2_02045 [Dehalococcoidia bacterium]